MNSSEKKALRAKAHTLKPIITVGQAGVSEPVMKEVEIALDFHELLKVRIRSSDREARKASIADICSQSGAELIQIIGQIGIIYRKKPQKSTGKK